MSDSGPITSVNQNLPSLFNSVHPNYIGRVRFQILTANGSYDASTKVFTLQGVSIPAGRINTIIIPATTGPSAQQQIAQGSFFVGPFASIEGFQEYSSNPSALADALLPGLVFELSISSAIRILNFDAPSTIAANDATYTIGGSGTVQLLKDQHVVGNINNCGAGANLTVGLGSWMGIHPGEKLEISPNFDIGVAHYLTTVRGAFQQDPSGYAIEHTGNQTVTIGSNLKGTRLYIPVRVIDVSVRCFSYGTGYFTTASGFVGPQITVQIPFRSWFSFSAPNMSYLYHDVVVDNPYLWSTTDPANPTFVIPTNNAGPPFPLDTAAKLNDYLSRLNGTTTATMPNLQPASQWCDRAHQFMSGFDTALP